MASPPLAPCLAFHVKRCEPELIVPEKPTPHELKSLSDIDDQEGLRFQVPFIWSYKNDSSASPSMTGKDPVKVIREALGKALVYYYPLAGRLVEGYNRMLLWIAMAKVLFDVPGSDGILGGPLLLIQVTRLVCGGFILALRFNHTMCDEFGLFQFLNTLAEMAQGAQVPSIPPVWQRELLVARLPPRVTCTHHEYPQDIPACLWKCRTHALKVDPQEVVRVSLFVTARGKQHGLSLPLGYYGNAFAFPAAVSKAGIYAKPVGICGGVGEEGQSRDEPRVHKISSRSYGDQRATALYRPAMAFPRISYYVKNKNKGEDGILVPMCLPFLAMERFQQELMVMNMYKHNTNPFKIISTL
ncbi:hypothetical protein FNV43_RR08392 [Rhamnella rubrinervis]|uniref:Uncharacterized protein n=1 Tax=Rhamnella rubrinervis TaxID=2594499 RepID=A0A8K0H937_9ROSA|nr:hypothetical protein FNV43_RR08392 [Rhamnella rubrinervis]